MKKSEIKARIKRLIDERVPRSEIFSSLRGQTLRDGVLASLIASSPDPILCKEHRGKVLILVGLSLLMAFYAFLQGAEIGGLIGGFLMSLFPLLFAWGFHANKLGAYNVYLGLSLAGLPRIFRDYSEEPVVSIGAFVANALLIVCVWRIKRQLFPDYALFGARKLKGNYVFTDLKLHPQTPLVSCVACGHNISTEAKACTNCGAKNRAYKSQVMKYLLLTSIIGIGVLFSYSYFSDWEWNERTTNCNTTQNREAFVDLINDSPYCQLNKLRVVDISEIKTVKAGKTLTDLVCEATVFFNNTETNRFRFTYTQSASGALLIKGEQR